MSSFGYQSLPAFSTFFSFAGPQDFNLDGPVLKTHQKQNDGNKIMVQQILLRYRTPKNFENLVYVSQLAQAENLKEAIEGQRRTKPYCNGSIIKYLNDSWPGINFSIIDYNGAWKAAGYFVKKAYAPILVSPVIENEKLKVYIISDRLVPLSGVLQVKISDLKGKEFFNQQIPVQIPANSNKVYFQSTEWKKFMKFKNLKNMVLEAKLSENNENFYRNLLYFVGPKDLVLPGLSKINLTINGKNGKFELAMSAKDFQKNIFLSSKAQGVNFSDNYFDMLPSEKIIINITCPPGLGPDELFKSLGIKGLRDSYK